MADNILTRWIRGKRESSQIGGERRKQSAEKQLEGSNEAQEYRDAKLREKEDSGMETTRDKMKRGFKKGGRVGSASKRADGIAQRGKTKGRMI